MKWLAGLLTAFFPTIAVAGDLTIATFNAEFLTRPKVHAKFGFPLDLKDPADIAQWSEPGFRDQKFAEGAKAVARVVASINADLIVLNEVGNRQDVDELNAAIASNGISYPHAAVCDCDDTFTTQHVAVLSKLPFDDVASKIVGREGYFRERDDDDSQDDTGISKGMAVRFTFEGKSFQLFGLHLASEAGSADADEQRVAQASIVRRTILPAIIEGKELVIVAGDLNDGRGQPALRRIGGYDDIWPDLIQTGDFKYFQQSADTRWTYEFQGTRNQIDHILLSPSVRTLVRKDTNIKPRVPDQNDKIASDHRPYVLTLSIP
jgi:endonuclease/exonuclease/phosphatase family metal-dependent hydrolase